MSKYENRQLKRQIHEKFIGSKRAANMTFKCDECGKNGLNWDDVVVFKNDACLCMNCTDAANK